jgi:hypothetical protein
MPAHCAPAHQPVRPRIPFVKQRLKHLASAILVQLSNTQSHAAVRQASSGATHILSSQISSKGRHMRPSMETKTSILSLKCQYTAPVWPLHAARYRPERFEIPLSRKTPLQPHPAAWCASHPLQPWFFEPSLTSPSPQRLLRRRKSISQLLSAFSIIHLCMYV